MLSQRIYNNVLTNNNKELIFSIETMEKSHDFLTSLTMTNKVKEIYFSKSINLDKRVKDYIRYVRDMNKIIKSEDVEYIKIHSTLLLYDFDSITFLYQRESERKIEDIKNIELYILFFTLFLIICIGLFILKPANKRFEEREKEITAEKDYSNIVIESNTNAIIALGMDLKVKTFNKAAEKIFNYSKDEMMDKDSLLKIIPSMYHERHIKGIGSYFKTGLLKNNSKALELFARRKNGDIFPIKISFGCNGQGDIKNRIVIANIQDISLQKEKEKVIKESTLLLQHYKIAMDTTSIVSKADPKGIITYVNEQFCEISKYSQKELLGKKHNIVRHSNMKKSVFKNMWETIKSKKIWRGQVENKAKDGSSYHVNAMIMPILDSNNEIVEYLSMRTDITDLIKIEQDIMSTQKEILFTLGELGELRSKETGHHVRRVALYSELLGIKSGLKYKEVNLLKMASPMHDIGKVAIPDEILLKPGKLSDEEMDIMKTHAQIGYEVFYKSTHKILQTAAIISHEHHEKYDGSGYPQGLKAEEISIYGRITALADVFDALSHDRVYKKAWSMDEVISFIKKEKGKSFDPILVDTFLDNLDEILKIKNEYNA